MCIAVVLRIYMHYPVGLHMHVCVGTIWFTQMHQGLQRRQRRLGQARPRLPKMPQEIPAQSPRALLRPQATPSKKAKHDHSSTPTGTGKTAWQANKKKKPVNRRLSFAENEVPETPPHRVSQKASAEDLTGEKPSAPSVLKRTQTVDGKGTSVRKDEALKRQRALEEELEGERLRQAAEAKALKKEHRT